MEPENTQGKSKRAKRISDFYAPHLDAIARIFVQEKERDLPTARRASAELGLPKFSNIHLIRWRGNPEWVTAVQAAREQRQIAERASGNVRGQNFLDWCRKTEVGLRDEYALVKGLLADAEDKKRTGIKEQMARLENRILRLAEAARAEEKHLEEQREREATRDMKRFGQKLLKKLADIGRPQAAVEVLNAVAKNPVGFMREDE